MHADDLPIDAHLVRDLIREQWPAGSDLPLRQHRTAGTVNAVFRLGSEHYVRLPRTARWGVDLEHEVRWLPAIGTAVSLAVPEPVFVGAPTTEYPCPWAVYCWIPGEPYADQPLGGHAAEADAAHRLEDFVTQLRDIPTSDAPCAGRGPLAEVDQATRDALADAHEIDRARTTDTWERMIASPSWAGSPQWIHADLLRLNLLVHDGRLAAVLDFGNAGIGDPAHDFIAAWAVFGPVGRAAYRERLDPGDGSWQRACGLALHQAALIIPYYRRTNPDFAALAVRTIEQILRDPA